MNIIKISRQPLASVKYIDVRISVSFPRFFSIKTSSSWVFQSLQSHWFGQFRIPFLRYCPNAKADLKLTNCIFFEMFPSNSNYQYRFGSVLTDSEGFLEPKIFSMQWKSSHGQWDACKKMTAFSSFTFPSMKLAIKSDDSFIPRQHCSFRCNQNRFEGEPYLKTPNRIGETFDREKIAFTSEEILPHHREEGSKKFSLIEIIQLKKPPDRGKVPRNPIFCTLLSENTTTHICFNRRIPISKNSAIVSVALNSRKNP